MKLKINKLREVSKDLSISFTGNTLKQELAENILKHFNKQSTNNISRDYKIRDNIEEKLNNSYTLTEFKLDHIFKSLHQISK